MLGKFGILVVLLILVLLFCAGGARSALAAKSLQEMGFNNVSHVEGGFGLMEQSGFKVI